MRNIELNREYTLSIMVKEEHLAKNVGSGTVSVLATPMMIAYMEKASAECLSEFLDEGETSVGTLVNVEHLSSTPIGMKVNFNVKITATDGRSVSFEAEAYDQKDLIGKGIHKRVIVNQQRFEQRAEQKNS
jgi:predicted thioesterase